MSAYIRVTGKSGKKVHFKISELMGALKSGLRTPKSKSVMEKLASGKSLNEDDLRTVMRAAKGGKLRSDLKGIDEKPKKGRKPKKPTLAERRAAAKRAKDLPDSDVDTSEGPDPNDTSGIEVGARLDPGYRGKKKKGKAEAKWGDGEGPFSVPASMYAFDYPGGPGDRVSLKSAKTELLKRDLKKFRKDQKHEMAAVRDIANAAIPRIVNELAKRAKSKKKKVKRGGGLNSRRRK